VRTLANKG